VVPASSGVEKRLALYINELLAALTRNYELHIAPVWPFCIMLILFRNMIIFVFTRMTKAGTQFIVISFSMCHCSQPAKKDTTAEAKALESS
jgi:hypothetical protein